MRGDKERFFSGVTKSGRNCQKGAGKQGLECGGGAWLIWLTVGQNRQKRCHTQSLAFRHLPPDSAVIGYATEGVLFTSHTCPPTLSAPSEKVLVLIRLWKHHSVQ